MSCGVTLPALVGIPTGCLCVPDMNSLLGNMTAAAIQVCAGCRGELCVPVQFWCSLSCAVTKDRESSFYSPYRSDHALLDTA